MFVEMPILPESTTSEKSNVTQMKKNDDYVPIQFSASKNDEGIYDFSNLYMYFKAIVLYFEKAILILLILQILSCQYPGKIDYSGPIDDWPSYGGTDFGERFSSLDQINPKNVKHLRVAWEYHTGDVSDDKGDIPSTTAFEATPILIDSTLYIPSPFNKVIALDPSSGKERWVYDPRIDLMGNYSNQLICRGVSYWKDQKCDKTTCFPRIFTATNDARLIAINAVNGAIIKDFGNEGEINLIDGVGEQLWKGEYQVTSPPTISNNLVIVGSAVGDNARTDAPSAPSTKYPIPYTCSFSSAFC